MNKILDWFSQRKLKKDPRAQQCQYCGRIILNDSIFPFAMCTNGHKPVGTVPIRR